MPRAVRSALNAASARESVESWGSWLLSWLPWVSKEPQSIVMTFTSEVRRQEGRGELEALGEVRVGVAPRDRRAGERPQRARHLDRAPEDVARASPARRCPRPPAPATAAPSARWGSPALVDTLSTRNSTPVRLRHRADRRLHGADLLGDAGVERDRLERVVGRSVEVEPAPQPPGRHLLEGPGEPVVAAVEVRAVGRRVVGRRQQRPGPSPGPPVPSPQQGVEAARVAVVAHAGDGRRWPRRVAPPVPGMTVRAHLGRRRGPLDARQPGALGGVGREVARSG